MRYYKLNIDGYLVSVGTGTGGTEITESEYSTIMQKIQTKPTDPNGYAYKLRADNLEWELVELPPVEPEPITEEEALTRCANSLTGASDPDLISAAETLIEKRIKQYDGERQKIDPYTVDKVAHTAYHAPHRGSPYSDKPSPR